MDTNKVADYVAVALLITFLIGAATLVLALIHHLWMAL